MTLKEAILKQFEFCMNIAEDILKHNRSEHIIRYANKYAEIECPMLGNTEADWVRICYGNIYIFLHTNGKIDYQLDPYGAYGSELIDVSNKEEFLTLLNNLSEDELIKHHYYISKNGDYSKDCPNKYTPMEYINTKIELTLNCFAPTIMMNIKVPHYRDTEEYIDELLESILSEEFRYNAEWDFI